MEYVRCADKGSAGRRVAFRVGPSSVASLGGPRGTAVTGSSEPEPSPPCGRNCCSSRLQAGFARSPPGALNNGYDQPRWFRGRHRRRRLRGALGGGEHHLLDLALSRQPDFGAAA